LGFVRCAAELTVRIACDTNGDGASVITRDTFPSEDGARYLHTVHKLAELRLARSLHTKHSERFYYFAFARF
jgi:hypothetical protein